MTATAVLFASVIGLVVVGAASAATPAPRQINVTDERLPDGKASTTRPAHGRVHGPGRGRSHGEVHGRSHGRSHGGVHGRSHRRGRGRAPTGRRSNIAVVVLAGVGAAVLLGPLVPMMVVSIAAAGRSIRRITAERRRRREIDAGLPDVIDLLVLTIHAGASPSQAIIDVRTHVGRAMRPAFDAVVHRLQRGHGLADAIGALPEILGPRASGVADGIAAAERYGLPLAPMLQGLSDEARSDRRRTAEAHARSLSVKLSFPLVVCTLPSFVLLAIIPALMGALSSLPASSLRP